MYPVLFTIPGLDFPIRSFGVLLAIGFLVGAHIWGRLIVRHGQDPIGDPERVSAITIAVLIGVVAGGRCFYVIVEMLRYWSTGDVNSAGFQYIDNPVSILFVWQGGLVMYGGFLGAIALGMRSAKKHGLHAVNALDTGLVGGFFGQAIGRIGCLLVGDDFGSVVPAGKENLPFPITIKVPDLEWLAANPESLFPHELAGQTLWCTQLWMSFNALCLGLLGVWLLRRRRYMGQVSLILIMCYAVGRFTIESFRGDKIRGLWFGDTVSTSQLISIVCGLIALALYVRLRKFRQDVPGSNQNPG
jgi:phosphatidylglycerol:prolipoprotein diacylglycerol transferase